MTDLIQFATDLVRIDSRSFVSNLAVADRIEAELSSFTVERLDYTDAAGVAKRALVARKGTGSGGLAFSGHMDTVPDTGWQDDPWSGRIADGFLHGLGSTDMKGPLAACIVAAKALPETIPVMLLITTDEETTKAGARIIESASQLVRAHPPAAILVAEPTRMVPVRGHRSSINFLATAEGVQAHSSTGRGRNANWALVGFLAAMKAIHDRLQTDPDWRDDAYDPPFSDFNLTIDNHGAPVNMTVPRATVRIKFRVSARMNPDPIIAEVRAAAAGRDLAVTREGPPLETAEDHPLIRLAVAMTNQKAITAPFGTDASELQPIAPCVVLGPGDIWEAHCPGEKLSLAALQAAVPAFIGLAERVAVPGWPAPPPAR
jgi:acetylornithine deacetylase/succinyl-diaminopimelate desuccinylase-like protein